MSLMDELVSAGVDSNELLGNPMKHEDFDTMNNLNDSSMLYSVSEDFTVDLSHMKNIYTDNKYDSTDITNKNDSTLFENCAINLDQELQHAVTGSSMEAVSDQKNFQESNFESNSLNVTQENVLATSQLPDQIMDGIKVQVSKMPKEILSLNEELSQVSSSESKTCNSVEMNECNSDKYDRHNKDHDDSNIENYDDNENTCNYENKIEFHDNDADNYDCSIMSRGDNDIVNCDVSMKDHDNNNVGYYDNGNKSHIDHDIDNYGNDNIDIDHSDTIDSHATNNDDGHGDNTIDSNDHDNSSQLCENVVDNIDIDHSNTSIKDCDTIDSHATNNDNDHRDNTIDDNDHDNSSQLLCENVVGEYNIAAETNKDVISSVVSTFSPKRDKEKEYSLIKDETNVENSLESHHMDMVKTEPSTEITGCVDIDMDEIRTESPTGISVDMDMINTECPVKDSNSVIISSKFSAEGTLNDSINTERSYKTNVCSNIEDSMSSVDCETDQRNESVIEQQVLDSYAEEDCETFEDRFLQQKANFLKKEKEVESLTKQLNDKQKLIQQAVTFGKQLLEENDELKEKVNTLEQKMIVIDEKMKKEKHSSKMKLESKEYMEQQYSEEISLLQNEITKIKSDVQSYQKQETHLNRELRNKDYLLEQSNLKEEELTTTIKNLEKLLLEKTEEAVHYSYQSFSEDNQQQIALEKKVLDLQTECTTLKSQLISSNASTARVEEELLRTKRRLDEKQQEYEEIRSEINSYEKTLALSQRDILDLKAQLYAAQVENMSRKDRGNSLFSEVEDRRVSAEKMLATLQENYQALKEKYNLEKQQNYKLKMQTMSLYQMNSSKGNETELEYLNSKLTQSQHEIKRLQEKIKSMEKHELQQNDKLLKVQQAFGTKENQDLIDFLDSANNNKQKELEIMQEKLNNLEMQYIQETNKVVSYMKKLRQAEEKVETLSYSNMKLKLQLDELLIKYKPDEMGDVRNHRKTKVEKVPLSCSENKLKSQNTLSCSENKLKSQKIHCKPEQKVPDENQPMSKQRKLELARCGFINPVDFLHGTPKAKKTVSISSNIETVDDEGNTEQQPLSTPSPTSQKTMNKTKGKPVPRHKIIEVKAPSDANKVECTQQ